MADLDSKVLKRTQDSLGKIIKKPPLSDKLLSKPPFRFLHDIVTSVVKTTGFMKGLYTDNEMNSDNVKDKDSKLGFLQKLIDIVCLVVEKQLSVKPSKIVAGHEPEKTNELLQCLAEAISKKPNNDAFVKRVMKGEKFTGEKSSSKSKSEKEAKLSKSSAAASGKKGTKPPGKASEGHVATKALATGKDEKHHSSKEKSDEKHRDRGDRGEDKRSQEKSRPGDRSRDGESRKHHEKDEEKKHRDRSNEEEEEKRHRERSKDERQRERHHRREEKENDDPENHSNDLDLDHTEEPEVKSRVPRPTSAKGSRRRQGRQMPQSDPPVDDANRSMMTTMTNDNDSGPPPDLVRGRSARPGSARPAPRIRKTEIVQEDAPVVSSGNVPNIIRDQDKDSDSEEEMFITKDEDPLEMVSQQQPTTTIIHQRDEDDEDEEDNHGGLVKKILETKKDLEGGSQNQQQVQQAKKTEIERVSQVSDSQRRKEREIQQREVDKLRGAIQVVTRSVNPLDRSLNYVQEDLDAMQQEMAMWKKEHRENLLALQREESEFLRKTQPMRKELLQLEAEAEEYQEKLFIIKYNIYENYRRIEHMVYTQNKPVYF